METANNPLGRGGGIGMLRRQANQCLAMVYDPWPVNHIALIDSFFRFVDAGGEKQPRNRYARLALTSLILGAQIDTYLDGKELTPDELWHRPIISMILRREGVLTTDLDSSLRGAGLMDIEKCALEIMFNIREADLVRAANEEYRKIHEFIRKEGAEIARQRREARKAIRKQEREKAARVEGDAQVAEAVSVAGKVCRLRSAGH